MSRPKRASDANSRGIAIWTTEVKLSKRLQQPQSVAREVFKLVKSHALRIRARTHRNESDVVYARLTFAALTDYDVVSVVLGDGVLFGRFCFQPAEKLVKPPHVLSGGEVELTQHVHI